MEVSSCAIRPRHAQLARRRVDELTVLCARSFIARTGPVRPARPLLVVRRPVVDPRHVLNGRAGSSAANEAPVPRQSQSARGFSPPPGLGGDSRCPAPSPAEREVCHERPPSPLGNISVLF